jgi:hypothetical protein
MAKKATKKQPDFVAAAAALPGKIADGVSSAFDAGVSAAKDAISDFQDGRKRPARKAASPGKRTPKPKATAKSSTAKSSSAKSSSSKS